MLAQAPEVTLVQWRVSSGGDGYPPCFVRSGTSAPELLSYLQMEAPVKPDFARIKHELHLALSQPELAGTYRLGQCKIEGWQLRAVVLHEWQKSKQGGCDMSPHSTVLYKVVRRINDNCKVPGYVGGAAHAPNGFYTLIGSVISFGYPSKES
jgi:hypothetical protein